MASAGLITPSLDEMSQVAKEMQRQSMQLPLLIGGATTSAKHTAVRIAPHYEPPVVHVLDASRCVGVVERLLNENAQEAFAAENRRKQAQLVQSFEQRDAKLVPYTEAYARRFATDWESLEPPRPEFQGYRVLRDIDLREVVPFIDWSPFFMAWELKGKYPAILDDPHVGPTARELFDDAQQRLQAILEDESLKAHAVYGFWPAASAEDDIILYTDESRTQELCRFHMLRQQWERKGQKDFRQLGPTMSPHRIRGKADYLGAFAVTAGHGAETLAARVRGSPRRCERHSGKSHRRSSGRGRWRK